MIQRFYHCHRSNLYSHQAILFQFCFDLMAISVNTADNDGGLRSCLESARLDPLIIKYIEDAGAQSLSDFVDSVTEKDYESELKTVFLDVVKVGELTHSKLNRSRLPDYVQHGQQARRR
jgi:hypothetical protein